MTHTIFSATVATSNWCVEQQPEGITDPMVVRFRKWNGQRSLLRQSARWTGDGWDATRWIPKPPVVPQGLLNLVEQHMRQQP